MNTDDLEGLNEATRKQITEWQKVTRDEAGNDAYALVQLRKGNLLYEDNKIEEALIAWRSINESDIREIFISAQWNISTFLMENDNLEGALQIWQRVEKTDDFKMYAQAQFNIGLFYFKLGKNEEAMHVWSNIEREYCTQVYAAAQLNIGLILFEMSNLEQALVTWNDIKRSDDPEKFAKAKFLAGIILISRNRYEEGIAELRSINIKDNSEIYSKAQFNIGLELIKDSAYINDARSAFDKARDIHPYEVYCYIQICDFLLTSDTYIFGRKLQVFLNKIILIIRELTLDSESLKHDQKLPERKLAHYTGVDTVNKLISTNNNDRALSSFRLNTINNVNDPSEGRLLNNYLNGVKGELFSIPDFDENFHAFISCFTFNHDSLNQFRLYGKQDNKEASGVSLVFKKDFFQSDTLLSGMSFLSSLIFTQAFDNSVKDIVIQGIAEKNEDNSSNKKKIDKKPVMRCIYIEPESDYLYLAQRNCLTFYREFKITENPEQEWDNYKKDIDSKTMKVKALLLKLKVIYQSLKTKHSSDFDCYSDFIDKTILPLKYLIKHSAFQEEQECRMVYITSLDRPEVQMDFGKFLYVEYETDVKSNLDKIYIAPAATQYQPYLAKLLCGTNIKIELSNNPYRQT